MSKWFLFYTVCALLLPIVWARVIDPSTYELWLKDRLKFVLIITLATALLVAVLTEWIVQRKGSIRLSDHIIWMFVSYLGIIIWGLVLYFTRKK